jgi:hypothetical protein
LSEDDVAFDFKVTFKDGTYCLAKAEDVIQAQEAACAKHQREFLECIFIGPSMPEIGPLEGAD